MNLLVLDLETGGLDPDHYDILEVAAIEITRDGYERRRFHSKVAPRWPVDPEAAAVNGYTEEGWRGASSPTAVRVQMEHTFSGGKLIPCGWNVEFDLRFLRVAGVQLPLSHHSIDLMAMGWNMVKRIDRPHLEDLCHELGIDGCSFHTAQGDVEAMVQCYRKMVGTPVT